MVETQKYWCCFSRFSSSVDSFSTVRCPRADGEDAYVEDVLDLIDAHDVDYFLPVCSPASAVADAKVVEALEGRRAKGLHFGTELTRTMDDKHKFQEFCANKLGEV